MDSKATVRENRFFRCRIAFLNAISNTMPVQEENVRAGKGVAAAVAVEKAATLCRTR